VATPRIVHRQANWTSQFRFNAFILATMRTFAQTYPQLIAQAVRHGYSDQDLGRLACAARLAEGLYDGLYRKTGTPFLCHGTRTASIVMAEDPSVDIVSAALLHAAYFLHCFKGSNRRGPRKADRARIRRELGPEIDELIEKYKELPWKHPEDMQRYPAQPRPFSPRMQKLVLLSLANELDDHLDAGESFTGKESDIPWRCVDLAEYAGYPELARELADAFQTCADSRFPAIVQTGKNGSYLARRLWLANPAERLGAIWRRYRMTKR